jgi:hypothetical protein
VRAEGGAIFESGKGGGPHVASVPAVFVPLPARQPPVPTRSAEPNPNWLAPSNPASEPTPHRPKCDKLALLAVAQIYGVPAAAGYRSISLIPGLNSLITKLTADEDAQAVCCLGGGVGCRTVAAKVFRPRP